MTSDAPVAWKGPASGAWQATDGSNGALTVPVVRWRIVGPDDPGPHDASGGHWWLAPQERASLERLRNEKRRADWLRGRRVAKALLTELVRDAFGRECASTDIDVARTAAGTPTVFVRDAAATRWAPIPALVSISHSHGHAVAAAVWTGSLSEHGRVPVGLGVDLERVEPRDAVFVSDYFTGREQAFCAGAGGTELDVRVTSVWSAKESALKALGLGLGADTRDVECVPEPTANSGSPDWLPLALATGLAPGTSFAGAWRRHGPFVLTLVLQSAAGGV